MASHQAKDLVRLIVLDVSLRDMNGFEVWQASLRAGGCLAKVIFLSCREMPGFVRRAFELSARGYVYKSRMADLAKAIHTAVAGWSLQPSLISGVFAEGEDRGRLRLRSRSLRLQGGSSPSAIMLGFQLIKVRLVPASANCSKATSADRFL